MHKIICTCFGIGYIPKGGGTVAAVLCCVCLYLLLSFNVQLSAAVSLLIAIFLTALGTWSANHVESLWGKDSYRVVIDEFAGMWISVLFVPISLATLLIGLVLFRVFDIWKPLYIRTMEKLPGGVGVMMDDVLAGVYSCALLNIIFRLNLIQ